MNGLVYLIYAIIGWCMEVIYAAVDDGKFVNRGFLNGPVCPIYGFGGSIVVACLYGLRGNGLIEFVGAFFLASILEYITGFLLEKIFHEHWWDYSDKPLNIKGYVCLKFSILWGLCCVFVLEVIQPGIEKFVKWIPVTIDKIVVIICMALFLADLIVTVATIVQWKKELRIMREIVDILRKFSGDVGDSISTAVLRSIERRAHWKEIFEQDEHFIEMKEEMERYKVDTQRLKEKYDLLEKRSFRLHSRLEKAFPRLSGSNPAHLIERWKEIKEKGLQNGRKEK